MIQLTRLNHVPLVLNSDLIEHIEATPDTVIALTSGQSFMVLEPPDEVVRLIIAFRRLIYRGLIYRPAVVRAHDCEPQTDSPEGGK
jgi:flagellar protein FlbD